MRWLRTLLLGTFLLGGPGLPLLDALLFHGLGAERVAQQRLDVPGSARPHADTCVLAAPLPIPGPVPLVIGGACPVAGRAPASVHAVPVLRCSRIRITFCPAPRTAPLDDLTQFHN